MSRSPALPTPLMPQLDPVHANGTTVPLSQLRAGDCARFHASELCCEECELLRAMGMSEECRLRVCRSGAPCIVEVNATRLGLSPAMSRRILVTLEPPAAART